MRRRSRPPTDDVELRRHAGAYGAGKLTSMSTTVRASLNAVVGGTNVTEAVRREGPVELHDMSREILELKCDQ